MDLIHADSNKKELRQIRRIKDFDSVISLSKESDYKLTIPTSVYEQNPIKIGHFIYIDKTEHGGVVSRVLSNGDDVEIYGKNWREYLNKNLIKPPNGQSRLSVSGNAKTIIEELLGDHFPIGFIEVEPSTVNVNDKFRYDYIGDGIRDMLYKADARLEVKYELGKLKLKAINVTDWSDKYEFNEDYGVLVKVDIDETECYNHIVALGKGELEQRLVLEAWLLEDGSITYDSSNLSKPTGETEITYKLDYPNADGLDDLKEKIEEKFRESKRITKTEMDLSGAQIFDVALGDIVASRDRVMNVYVKQQIDSKLLKINDIGIPKVRYKVREVE